MAERVARSVGAVLGGFAAGLVVTVIAVSALSSIHAMPVRLLSVLSGSMAPTIDTGDAVVVQSVSARSMRVGDIVSFRDPERDGRLVTHRVRALRLSGDVASVVTRGDANTGSERWTVPADGRIGLVRQRLPRLGVMLAGFQSRPGRLLLIVLPALILCAIELHRVWAPSPEPAQLTLF